MYAMNNDGSSLFRESFPLTLLVIVLKRAVKYSAEKQQTTTLMTIPIFAPPYHASKNKFMFRTPM